MAVTIYTNRAAIGDGTLWNTSGTYRLKTGANSDLWVKITDTATLSPSAPTATASGSYFSVGTITTKYTEGYTWIGTIRLIAGTATTNTNQTLTIKYGSTNYTCNIRINGTANGFSTNPTLASNFTYDDSDHAPLTAWGASKSANLFWAMSTSNTLPPDSGWTNALSSFTSKIRNAGTYYLWYRMQSTSTTYNDVFPTLYGTSITCSKATLTCTGSSHTVTYSDAVPILSISYSGWKGDDGTSDLTTLPTVTTTYTRGSNKGSYPTTVSGGSAINYSFSYVAGSITVAAKTANLAWGTASWTYDGQTHSTTCGVSNLYGTDTCTVTLSGNSVGANVGSATVTATALSNSNYILPSSKTKTISITARAVTVTAANKSKTYGDANPTFTSSVTSGSLVSSGDLGTLSGTCSATTASTVGTYTITPSYTANSNYTVTTANGTLTINKRTVTITFGSTKSWTYDGNAHSVTITVGNTVNSDSITATSTGNSITNYGSSTVTVTGLSGTKASNYQLPSSGLTATISITKRSVTLTAANKSKSYGDANPTLTSSITSGSLVNSGDLGTLGATTTATQSSTVGTYTITPTYTANNNYTVTTANGTLTINKRTVTITFGTVTWVYDGSAHSTSITLGNIYGSDIVRVTATGNSITHKGTSTCTVTALDNSNYQLPSSGKSTTLTITQATTVLTWSSYTTPIRVGETKPVSATTNFGTVSYSSSDTSIATISGTNISAIASGSCTITAAVATNSYGDWTAASITFTLVVINGTKIYYDGEYKDAIPYVYFDGAWRKAIVYVHDGTTWKSC